MSGVRGQLTTLVGATTSVVLLALLVPIGLLLRSEAEQQAIATATLRAQALAAVVALDPESTGQLETSPSDQPRVSVFLPDGQVRGSPAAHTPSVELAARGRAFTARSGGGISGGGIEVLVPVQGRLSGTSVIRVYMPEPLLHQGVYRSWALLAGLGLLVFLLGLLLADRLGRRLVGSVTALAATADRLATGDLSARADPGGARELQRVGEQLNRLATRIGELLAAEREDVADLAHRLRTPMTALRLDVDGLADRAARDRLGADVDSLGRVVDEVIRTARRPVREGVAAAADLVEVAGERAGFWSALAEETGRPLDVALPGHPVPVRASRDDLAAALDALLQNVFAHTPDQAPVRVEVLSTSDAASFGWTTADLAGRRTCRPAAATAATAPPASACPSPAAPPRPAAAPSGSPPARSAAPAPSSASPHLCDLCVVADVCGGDRRLARNTAHAPEAVGHVDRPPSGIQGGSDSSRNAIGSLDVDGQAGYRADSDLDPELAAVRFYIAR